VKNLFYVYTSNRVKETLLSFTLKSSKLLQEFRLIERHKSDKLSLIQFSITVDEGFCSPSF